VSEWQDSTRKIH